MNDDDRRPWVSIGFRFGLGFWAAGAAFSLAGAALTWFAITHQFSTASSRAAAKASPTMRPEPFRAPDDLPMVSVPPRSVEACKALTGGQINEDFARCRRGYVEAR